MFEATRRPTMAGMDTSKTPARSSFTAGRSRRSSVHEGIAMRVGVLVIIGAVLAPVAGATLGSITTSDGEGTWAFPIQPDAFLLMSICLAAAHLLIAVGYVEVGRRSTGAASGFANLGALGTVLVAGVEIWSGLAARADSDDAVITWLDRGYFVTAVLILVGTLGSGIALLKAGSRLAMPLLVNGVFFALVIPVRFFGTDGPTIDALIIAGLSIWSLLYIWLGIRLGVRRKVTSGTT